MSKVYTDPENYENIAEAIREQIGTSDTYKPSEMADAIRSIAGGGGSSTAFCYAEAIRLQSGSTYELTAPIPKGLCVIEAIHRDTITVPSDWTRLYTTVGSRIPEESLHQMVSVFYKHFEDPHISFTETIAGTTGSWPVNIHIFKSAGDPKVYKMEQLTTGQHISLVKATSNAVLWSRHEIYWWSDAGNGWRTTEGWQPIYVASGYGRLCTVVDYTYGHELDIYPSGALGKWAGEVFAISIPGDGIVEPVIEPLTALENGIYTVPAGIDGYSPVTVNVSGGGEPRLPPAYQEVEYISGTGEQYIDTQTQVPAGATFEFEMENLFNTWGNYFGTDNVTGFRFLNGGSSGQGYLQYNSSSGGSFSFPFEKRDTYFLDGSTLYNSMGIQYYTHTAFPVSNFPLLLWQARFRGEFDVAGKFKLYRFVMRSATDEVLLQLVPCYRKADNAVGLYDLVSGTFFPNSGTGEFLKGPNVTYSLQTITATENGEYTPSTGYIGFDKVTVNVSGITPRIPDAYMELEYIGSTGTQYIDTGETKIDGIDITFQYTTADKSIFGARDSGGYNRFGLTVWDGKFHVMPPGFNADTANIGVHRLKYGANWDWKLFYDDLERCTSEDHTISESRTMCLFGENYISSFSQMASCRIYAAKLYRGSVLVQDFIPCYRKADGVCGMYEAVSESFFQNSGTGVFVKGPPAVSPHESLVLTAEDATIVSGYYLAIGTDAIESYADATCSYLMFDLTGYEERPIDICISGGNRQRFGFAAREMVGQDRVSAKFVNNTGDTITAESPYIYSDKFGYIRLIPTGYPFLLLYTSNQAMSETIPIRIVVGNI